MGKRIQSPKQIGKTITKNSRIKYRKIVTVAPVLAIILLFLPGPAHAANSTLFYDNFSPNLAGFPTQWSPYTPTGGSAVASALANITQSNNYAIITLQRNQGATNSCDNLVYTCIVGMIANNSKIPVIGPNTGDGSFVQQIWRIAPFNLSTPGVVGEKRVAEVAFGITDGGSTQAAALQGSDYIAFHVATTEFTTFNGQRQLIMAQIARPMSGANTCFDVGQTDASGNNQLALTNGVPNCTTPQKELIYPTLSGIDLNQVHIFTIQAKFFPVSHTSWVAFSVDNNAWLNITQGGCSCIDQTAAGGSYASLYPYIMLSYHTVGGIKPNQALGSQLNYVLVTDYPASAPLGQPFSLIPGKLPTSSNNAPFCQFGGFCPPSSSGYGLGSYFQNLSTSLGSGNTFVGGYLLLWIIVAVFVGVLAFLGIRNTWIFGLIVLSVTSLLFMLSVISIWTVALQFLIVAGAAFGLYRTRLGKMDG